MKLFLSTKFSTKGCAHYEHVASTLSKADSAHINTAYYYNYYLNNLKIKVYS
jgi:hypothetical protein